MICLSAGKAEGSASAARSKRENPMTPARLLGPLTMLASILLYSSSFSIEGEADPFALQAALGLFSAGAILTLAARYALAMSWLRSVLPQKEGDFSAAPPARRVTIRIRCHR
jgi:ABC-type uncharacterized transport system permease subunit